PLQELHYPALLDSVTPGAGERIQIEPLQPEGPGALPRVDPRGGDIRVGRGVALSLVMINTPTTSNATLRLNDDGSLDVLTSSVDMGQGAHTVLAQIAAEALSLELRRVKIAQPDTAATPFAHATTSSRTTFS